MRLIHKHPQTGERTEHVFKVNETLSPDAEAIELVGGEAWETWDDFTRLFNRGHRRALRAAWWVASGARAEGRRFADLVFRADELAIDYDEEELKSMRTRIRADTGLADEVRAALLNALGGDQPSDTEETAAPKARPSARPRKRTGTRSAGANTGG